MPPTSLVERVTEMLAASGTPDAPLPPTALYNESWMVRLVLDWFARHPGVDHLLAPRPGARWYSEALLPSPFLARRHVDLRAHYGDGAGPGDPLAEGWTHADGAVGHFTVGTRGDGDLALTAGATQLVIVEAKMRSPLSPGTSRIAGYDQAARTVACMAEVLRLARRRPEEVPALAFVVLAPAAQIRRGVFDAMLDPASIGTKVRARVDAYGAHAGDRRAWHDAWFGPTLAGVAARLAPVSWEAVLDDIGRVDTAVGRDLGAFYEACLRYGGLVDGSRPAARAGAGLAPDGPEGGAT